LHPAGLWRKFFRRPAKATGTNARTMKILVIVAMALGLAYCGYLGLLYVGQDLSLIHISEPTRPY
jgi:hypothetical protein